MPTYDKDTGSAGHMRIVDTGTTIEFWLKADISATFFGSATFSYSAPGHSGSFSHGYDSGATWQKMFTTPAITANGTVSWTMPATGTSSFGGPTTQSVSISRSTVPSAPTTKVPTAITHTGMTFEFDDGANGGSAITGREYQVSTSSAFTGASWANAPSNGIVTVTNLEPGVTYYWRARTKNANGYSAAGTTRSAETLPPVMVRVSGTWKKSIPYVRVSGTWKPAIAYVRKSGVWTSTD